MILDDTPTFPALFLGAMRTGAVPAPVSFLDTTENFAHYARDSYAKRDRGRGRAARAAAARARWRASQFEALMADAAGSDRPGRHAPRRHGLLALQRRLDRLPEGRRAPAPRHPVHVRDVRARRSFGITEDDVTFSSTKLYHAYGLGNNLTFPYWVGATTVLRPGTPGPARAAGDRAGAPADACSSACPRCTARWSTCRTRVEHDLSSRAHVRVRRRAARARGAAPLAGGFGLDIVDGIGSTEMLHIYCSNRPGDVAPGHERQAGARATSCVLLDELGAPVADGEVGNLYVRGDSALAYYWHQHEKTKAAINGDLFFTGDRYRVNERRRLRLRGPRRRHDQDRRAVGVARSRSRTRSSSTRACSRRPRSASRPTTRRA